MEDFTTQWQVEIPEDSPGPRDSRHFNRYRIKTNEPTWTDIRDKSVKDLYVNYIEFLDGQKRMSENAKRLFHSGNFTIELELNGGSYSQLGGRELGKSLGEFVDDFKFFRPDENELIVGLFFS